MFAGKALINKICKIHYRTLQVVYDDFAKSYDEHLELDRDLSKGVTQFAGECFFFNLDLRRTKSSVYLTNVFFLLTRSSH